MQMIFAVGYVTYAVAKDKPGRYLSPNLCNAGAVICQLSYQTNWELVIMWVNDKPVDSVTVKSKIASNYCARMLNNVINIME